MIICLSLTAQGQEDNSITCAQKTKKLVFNCCVPKLTKIACAYCCFGKSCIDTVQSFGEYKLATAVIPLLHNSYCVGSTITTCTCALCIVALYKNYNYQDNQTTHPSNHTVMMNYNNNDI